jgi:hypothetical protein
MRSEAKLLEREANRLGVGGRCKSYALRASRLHSSGGVQMRSKAKLLERQGTGSVWGRRRCKSYALRASRLHSSGGVQKRSEAKLLERQANRHGVGEEALQKLRAARFAFALQRWSSKA